MGREAALESETAEYQVHRVQWFYDCCAAEREQAPSPQ